jgi:hypothetical protein
MVRGKRPLTAIAEAKRKAASWGFVLIELTVSVPVPFDFAIHDNGATSLVRVRRLRLNEYRADSIARSCAVQVRELRELALPYGIGRELWVRGPQRVWHRYRITPETVEEVTDVQRAEPLPAQPGPPGGDVVIGRGKPE